MSHSNRRLASAISALVWAGVILYFYISGRIDLYLVPAFRNYVVFAGLGLAVVGLFVILTNGYRSDCGHDHGAGECHHHEGGDMPASGILVAMLAPLLATFFLTKDSFSLRALTHKGAFEETPKITAPALPGGIPSRETLETARPRNETGAIVLDLLEIYFSAMDEEYARNMDRLKVAVQGRILMGPSAASPHSMVYRLLLTCCAADGRPLSVRAEWSPGLTLLPENSWGELEGILTYQKTDQGLLIPVLQVERLSEKPAPKEEYLLRY